MAVRENAARSSVPPLRVVSSRRPPVHRRGGGRVPNVVIGMLVFLAAEAMLFAGMISVLLILRANADAWPPLDQPRLPIAVTAMNTLILLASGYTMHRASGALLAAGQRAAVRWLGITAGLGAIFLAVQGSEWVRLLHFGLHLSSGTYAATFYTLIGAHALHVLAGLVVLLFVLRRTAAGRYSSANRGGLDASRLYWFFVVGIWPVLYVLVYLT